MRTVTLMPQAVLLLISLYKGYHPKEFSGNEGAPLAAACKVWKRLAHSGNGFWSAHGIEE